MLRSSPLAACVSLAATLTVAAASPATAQSVSGREPSAVTAPQVLATAPQLPSPSAEARPAPQLPPAEESPRPPPAADPAPQPPQPAPPAPAPAEATVAPMPPVVEIDPLIAEVRQQLATARLGNVAAADRAALKAFYGERAAAIWVTAEGLTQRARNAMTEIAKADDWGLSARAFELPAADAGDRSAGALANAEIKLSLAALKYARHARGGRLDPSQVSRNIDQDPPLRDPRQVLEAVAAAETPDGYLRDLHPKHPQFVRLRQALLEVRGRGSRAEEKAETVVRLPDGPVLKLGMEHPHVALLRQRLNLIAPPGAENVYDLGVQEAVAEYQGKMGFRPDGVVGPRTRAALNGVERSTPTFGSEEERLIVNMERWRWMPEDLGQFHVWDNIPEFQTRVVRRGQVIHQARIIVGKPETPTAVFSANMRYVIFGPEWGVPDSIKVKEILPYLRPSFEPSFFGFGGGGVTDTRILEKHNLRVSMNGRPVDASQIDWTQVDIKKFNFIQPAGPGNVLGAVKFRFPNKHDIYMHDTPQRELFEKTVRTFSHGCVRVHNPGRLAEVLLEEDKGWSAARVRELMARGAEGISYDVTLTKQIPVHITYFTMVVGEEGQVQSFGDIYGHDRRVAAALAGRPLPLEPPSSSSTPAKQEVREPRRQRPYAQNTNDIFSGLFGN